jgi:hypothetical protein
LVDDELQGVLARRLEPLTDSVWIEITERTGPLAELSALRWEPPEPDARALYVWEIEVAQNIRAAL